MRLFEKLHPIADLGIVCHLDPSLGDHELENQHHKGGGKSDSRKDFIQSSMGLLLFFFLDLESCR